MIDENDFIRKYYQGKDKLRTQKWFMRYCDDCGVKLTYLPRNKTGRCASCAAIRKFAKQASLSLEEYKPFAELRKLNDKLGNTLRNRINKAINSNAKAGSAVRDLGCTIDEFRLYIENQFQSGMTWENRGTFGWHLDHIVPLSKFNLTNTDDFKRACHYTNMRPLWWRDNLSKGKK